ncbi:energy transducer TonB [Arcticibacterium luteifluviistationis]|uniref:Energy transducer TonB n=1 Tax=Arcticibacterium luteifluviistationis TaxID=1784714 RepID=A0A2Z4GC97_9BACT|nr:energy transducer TonB [Arcticibacterium luteifluviistationis]AWV98764.1 energy transducer TonB [Arcticibacterium luteifluviistationis]
MENEKDLQTLDDMLFEGKNKAYGAYDLRQKYSSHLSKAFVLGVSGVVFISLSSFFVVKSQTKEVVHEDKPYTVVDLLDWHEPRVDLPIEEEQTPPVKQEVFEQVVIPEFVEPVADTKDIIEADVPTKEEIETAVISTIKQEGKASINTFENSGPIVQEGLSIKVPEPPVMPKVEKEFLRSEIMPEFNGGLKKMYKWFGRNLQYPRNASLNGVEGRVIVTFIVEKDGGISDVKVLKGIGFGCDEEAARVIKKMPKWNAGIQNGKTVRVRYTIPLSFQMN